MKVAVAAEELTEEHGDTLVILAAYHGHQETVRALLDGGADVARVNEAGQNALCAAVFRNSTENVTMVLAAGADPRQGPRSAIEVARAGRHDSAPIRPVRYALRPTPDIIRQLVICSSTLI